MIKGLSISNNRRKQLGVRALLVSLLFGGALYPISVEAGRSKLSGDWFSVEKMEDLESKDVLSFFSHWGHDLSKKKMSKDSSHSLFQEPTKLTHKESFPLSELVEQSPQTFGSLLDKYYSKPTHLSPQVDDLLVENNFPMPQKKDHFKENSKEQPQSSLVVRVEPEREKKDFVEHSTSGTAKIQIKVQKTDLETQSSQSQQSPLYEKPASHDVINLFDMIQAQKSTVPLLALNISEDKKSQSLTLSKDKVEFSKVGEELSLNFDETLKDKKQDIKIFVRNEDLVTWDDENKTLRASKEGSTEVYFFYNSKMHILPVVTHDFTSSEQLVENLSLPKSLTSIDRLNTFETPVSLAHYRSSSTPKSSLEKGMDLVAPLRTKSYFQEKKEAIHQSITVQLVDDRTVDQNIYPAPSVFMKILGTGKSYKSDSKGKISGLNVPESSRFLVEIQDPRGLYLSTVKEVSTADLIEGEMITVKLLRRFIFDHFQQVVGGYQSAGRSSFCGVVSGTGQKEDLSGYQVSTDIADTKPYYFNRYGYLDPGLQKTGPDGKFCYFNMVSGPLSVDLSKDSGPISTYPLALYSDKHHEFDFKLENKAHIKTHLTSVPTAHEQVEGNLFNYTEVDMIDLYPMGYGDPLMQLDHSIAGSQDGLTSFNERVFYLSQASEFEATLYSFSASRGSMSHEDENHITPLFPRGFVEDMSVLAEQPFDPFSGALVIEHGEVIGQEEDEYINIRLVDSNGQNVSQAVDFSGSGKDVRRLFLNVEPGLYTVMVETADGFWLASDTAMVYSETLSYIRTGSSVVYKNTVSYLD